MSVLPPQEVIDAIESGENKVTRRVEFYQSDGNTLWAPNYNTEPRLIDGNVSLDYSRDERRVFDIQVDNADNYLRPDPLNGLWYDKIIKLYRGIEYYGSVATQVVTATNLVTNPSFESGLSGYGFSNGVNSSQSNVWAQYGSYSLRIAAAGGNTDSFVSVENDTGGIRLGMQAGKTYTVSAYGYMPAAFIGTIGTRAKKIVAFVRAPSVNGGNYQEYDSTATVTTGAAQRISLTFTVPADASEAFIRLYNGSDNAADVIYWDAVMLNEGSTLLTYFDGSQPGARWTGTANASTSELLSTVYVKQVTTWETQLGEFMIDKIDEDSFPHITKLAGRDYTKKCMVSKFGMSTSFPEGTNVVTLIKDIAANAGITKFRLPISTETLGGILAVDRTQTRWEIMKQLAESFGYDIYFDTLGYLTLSRFRDPVISALAWTFKTGSKGNLVKWTRSTSDSRLYNHVVVTGEGGDVAALPFFGEALNTEPSSPTRISRIGDRVFFYTSSYFTSDQQCVDLANAWLKVKALESYESTWDSFNYPWMDVGEIVAFIDPRRAAHEPVRYLMDTLTIPLGLGPMSATAKRVTIVSGSTSTYIPAGSTV